MYSVNYGVLASLNLLNVEDRVKQLALNHVFNIFHGNATSYLCVNVVIRSEVSIHRTRSCTSLDFIVPHIKHVNLVPSFTMVLRIGTSFLVTSRNVKEKTFLKL